MTTVKSAVSSAMQKFFKGKSFFIGFGLAFGIVIGGAAMQNGGGSKVGYVDTEQVMSAMPETKKIQDQIQKLTAGWQTEFDKMKKEAEDMAKDYELKKASMTEDARKKKEEEIQKKVQVLQEYQGKKLGRGGELEQKQVELLKPLETKVIAAIEKVAKSNGYAIVLSRGGVANPVLYGDKSNDLTFKVMDAVK
jgi:outer membrane protein